MAEARKSGVMFMFWVVVAVAISYTMRADGFHDGYDKGYKDASRDKSEIAADERSTMDAMGVCRWAHVAGGCPLPPGETMTNGTEQLLRWQKMHRVKP